MPEIKVSKYQTTRRANIERLEDINRLLDQVTDLSDFCEEYLQRSFVDDDRGMGVIIFPEYVFYGDVTPEKSSKNDLMVIYLHERILVHAIAIYCICSSDEEMKDLAKTLHDLGKDSVSMIHCTPVANKTWVRVGCHYNGYH